MSEMMMKGKDDSGGAKKSVTKVSYAGNGNKDEK